MSRNNDNNNTALIVFAVIVAFGLVTATVTVLPNVPHARAVIKTDKFCKDGTPRPYNSSHKEK
jgi:hypothetical protein